MHYQRQTGKLGANTTTNTAGRIAVTTAAVAAKNAVPVRGHSREAFFNDLKKVVKKLPPDHPSRSDSRKR